MLKIISTAAIAVIMASPAWATHPGDPPPPNNSPVVNEGGAGGKANAAAAALAAAKAKATATGGTATGGAGGGGGQGGVGGGGGQGGGGGTASANGGGNGNSVSNVGNTYNPNYPAASAYSMAYATFCINAQGIGAQAPWPLPGVSFSITWMRDLCRWGHIAEMREKVGDSVGAEWARCQISEYAEADKNGSQQCPQNRAKAKPAEAMTVSTAPVPIIGNTPQCFDAAGRIVPVGQAGAVRCH